MFPEKLQQYLNEQIIEGSDIHIVNENLCDGYNWVIIPKNLANWVVLVQWYEGSDTFALINLQGRTLQYVKDLQVK